MARRGADTRGSDTSDTDSTRAATPGGADDQEPVMPHSSKSLHPLRQRLGRTARTIATLPLRIPPKTGLAIPPATHILAAVRRSWSLPGAPTGLQPC
jgi:hypothetical protein